MKEHDSREIYFENSTHVTQVAREFTKKQLQVLNKINNIDQTLINEWKQKRKKKDESWATTNRIEAAHSANAKQWICVTKQKTANFRLSKLSDGRIRRKVSCCGKHSALTNNNHKKCMVFMKQILSIKQWLYRFRWNFLSDGMECNYISIWTAVVWRHSINLFRWRRNTLKLSLSLAKIPSDWYQTQSHSYPLPPKNILQKFVNQLKFISQK